ncbi:MAG: hypothetical protein KJ558_09030 [Gammaproteobacteria bacterium]|nr:hypothetical protein [Gammaproteobacteria bacterium]MBU1654950.1 hypothetical protein [Gammaproteobacteria bacterium]MBU1960502.1 hypothetical protein [Gammaproteobacteria bacterium]
MTLDCIRQQSEVMGGKACIRLAVGMILGRMGAAKAPDVETTAFAARLISSYPCGCLSLFP